MNTIYIKETLHTAWRSFTENWVKALLATIVFSLIPALVLMIVMGGVFLSNPEIINLLMSLEEGNAAATGELPISNSLFIGGFIAVALLHIIVSAYITGGYIDYLIGLYDRQPRPLSVIVTSTQFFPRMLLAMVSIALLFSALVIVMITGVIALPEAVALVVAIAFFFVLLYLILSLVFVYIAIVDSHHSAGTAIRESFEITKGAKLKMFAVFAVIGVIAILLSLIPIVNFVVQLVVMPLFAFAALHMYRTLTDQETHEVSDTASPHDLATGATPQNNENTYQDTVSGEGEQERLN